MVFKSPNLSLLFRVSNQTCSPFHQPRPTAAVGTRISWLQTRLTFPLTRFLAAVPTTFCFRISRQTKWMIIYSGTVGMTIIGTPIHFNHRASQQLDFTKMRLCSIRIIISFNSLNNSHKRSSSSNFRTISNTFCKHKLIQVKKKYVI